VGSRVAEKHGERQGIDAGVTADLVTYIVLCGFIFGYFLNAAFYEPETFVAILKDPRKLFSHYLGLSSFGGFIGAVVGILWWRARRGRTVLPVADAVAFGFPFGWVFGRMGCFVVHDHPGRPSDFFLAVADYPVGSPPYVARHDLGLYEMLWSMAVAALFSYLARRRRPAGFYLAALPLLYAPIRFVLDELRASPEEGGDIRYGGLTPGQYAALGFFILGLAIASYLRSRPVTELAAGSDMETEDDDDAHMDDDAQIAAPATGDVHAMPTRVRGEAEMQAALDAAAAHAAQHSLTGRRDE
ncbi:MAG: prolipoprotein diacylglyceryl transferase, partial [Polyangiales bacterium]